MVRWEKREKEGEGGEGGGYVGEVVGEHEGGVRGVQVVGKGGGRMVTGSVDGVVKTWDVQNGLFLFCFLFFFSFVFSFVLFCFVLFCFVLFVFFFNTNHKRSLHSNDA